MPPAFTTTRRVEFGDTDMAGIMHFANFFRFMEAAETSFLHTLGLSVSWKRDGVKWGFPRVSVACDFQRPARFEDVLTVAVTVERVVRRNEQPAAGGVDQLREAAVRRLHHRYAVGPRLQHVQPLRLLVRGRHREHVE